MGPSPCEEGNVYLIYVMEDTREFVRSMDHTMVVGDHLLKVSTSEVYGDLTEHPQPDIFLAREKPDGWEPLVPLREGLIQTTACFKGLLAMDI